jgi:hypothetical protein
MILLTAGRAHAQPAVHGTGTPGQIPKWIGSSVQGDSIISEFGGNVGIGGAPTASKLAVGGLIEATLGGYKFPDGTTQTTAAVSGIQSVHHDTTLTGDGRAASPLGVAIPLSLTGSGGSPGLLNVTNQHGTAITAVAGDGQTADVDGGSGLFVVGGNNFFGTGGVGAFLFGGHGSAGGKGIQTHGGDGNTTNGGDGLAATGGQGFGSSSSGGSGLTAQGGDSKTAIAGAGVVAKGGQSGNIGGDGVVAYAGPGPMPGNGIVAYAFPGFTSNYAGIFGGNVFVTGDLTVAGTKNFKMDHPLDPGNKYLLHAAVESSEVLDVYSGNVLIGPDGGAVVSLPEWFEALNRDFRYQLTAIGAPAPGLYVAEEIAAGHFRIAGGVPGKRVSWQVTAVRSDAAMRQHPFRPVVDKPDSERGTYVHPEAFGQPEEKGIEWARHPEHMRKLRDMRNEARKVEAE